MTITVTVSGCDVSSPHGGCGWVQVAVVPTPANVPVSNCPRSLLPHAVNTASPIVASNSSNKRLYKIRPRIVYSPTLGPICSPGVIPVLNTSAAGLPTHRRLIAAHYTSAATDASAWIGDQMGTRLQGKIVVVPGGSRGSGSGIAERMAGGARSRWSTTVPTSPPRR